MELIDGQHRLLAAKKSSSSIYYIIVSGYHLSEVQVLNLNQKNWTKTDFMEGYADMGIESYIKLRDFVLEYSDFNLTNCIAMCANRVTDASDISQKFRPQNLTEDKFYKQKHVFQEGTWIGKDFDIARENANKIRTLKHLYEGYNRSTFVQAMLGLFNNENFNFLQFKQKLKMQTQKMKDCTTVSQYRSLIEEIYNYRNKNKVNLRFN